MKQRLTYICLQSRKEGTAGYTHVTEIIKGLQKRGWCIDLFEPFYKKSGHNPSALMRIIEFLKIQFRFIFGAQPFPQALYLRSHFALLPVAVYAKLIGIPVIQEINSPYEDFFIAWPLARKFSWIYKSFLKLQYRIADAAIAVTPQLGDWFVRQGGKNSVFIIPNGANTDLFHPKAVSVMTPPKPYALFFGALSSWQGIDTILAAVKHKRWPNRLNLVIAGDGIEQTKVQSATENDQRVVYLGEVPYISIPGLITGSMMCLNPKSDVTAHAKTGLFPLKLFETLACGVPIIVTDFPGQADLVKTHQCGLVIKPNDPAELADAVAFLYHHPEERKLMGQNGSDTIKNGHSWDKRAEDTDIALKKIIKNRSQP